MREKVSKKDLKTYFKEQEELIYKSEEKSKKAKADIINFISNLFFNIVLTISLIFAFFAFCINKGYKTEWVYLFLLIEPWIYFILKYFIESFSKWFNKWRGIILVILELILSLVFFIFVSYNLTDTQFYNLLILTWTIYSCMIVFVTVWRTISRKRHKELISNNKQEALIKTIKRDSFINILLIINIIINASTTVLYFWNITNFDFKFMKSLLFFGGFFTCFMAVYIISSVLIEPVAIHFTILAISKRKKKLDKSYKRINKELKEKYENEEITDYKKKLDDAYNKVITEQDKLIKDLVNNENILID